MSSKKHKPTNENGLLKLNKNDFDHQGQKIFMEFQASESNHVGLISYQCNGIRHQKKFRLQIQNDDHPQITRQMLVQFFEQNLTQQMISPSYLKDTLIDLLLLKDKNSKCQELIYVALKKRPILFISYSDYEQKMEKYIHQRNIYYHLNKIQKPFGQNVKLFNIIVRQIQVSDYSFLYQIQKSLKIFVFMVLNNWNQLQKIYTESFQQLLSLINQIFQNTTLKKVLYPQIYQIKMILKSNFNQKKKKFQRKRHFKNILIQYYIEQLTTRLKQNVYRKISISKFISVCSRFFEESKSWKDIFERVTNHLYFKQLEVSTQPNNHNSQELQQNFPCFGCKKFFYYDKKFKKPQECQQAISFMGSIKQMNANIINIKDQTCALLNGGGGIMVFDIKIIFKSIIPFGVYLTERTKKIYQENIMNIFADIKPQIKIKKNFIISWIPFCDNIQFQQNLQHSRSYIPGLFIARIVLKPTNLQRGYYWLQNNEPIITIRVQNDCFYGCVQAIGIQASKYTNTKKEENKIRKIHPEHERNMNFCPSLPHEYQHPQIGHRLHKMPKDKKDYRYATFIQGKEDQSEKIEKFLQENNFLCKCQVLSFLQQNEKQKIIHILYHDIKLNGHIHRFEDKFYLKIDKNRFYDFSRVTKYMKLISWNHENGLKQTDFVILSSQLKEKYPKEILKLWRYKYQSEGAQFYLQTSSYQSSLFIFFLYQILKIGSLIFQNPKGFQNIYIQQRKQRILQIYAKTKTQ